MKATFFDVTLDTLSARIRMIVRETSVGGLVSITNVYTQTHLHQSIAYDTNQNVYTCASTLISLYEAQPIFSECAKWCG